MALSDLFLTSTEVTDLTGYKYASKQIDWLKNNQYIFEINSSGKPKILRSHLISRLSESPKQTTPNFGALRRGKKTA